MPNWTPYATRHDILICVTWLIHMCDLTHSYVWHDSHVWHDLFICVTWLARGCNRTDSYVWRDLLTVVTRLVHTRVTWLFHTCDMTPPYVWHNFFLAATWLIIHVNTHTHTHTQDTPTHTWHTHTHTHTHTHHSCKHNSHLTRHKSLSCPTWLMNTHATWLIHACAQNLFNVHTYCFFVPRLLYMCAWICVQKTIP